MDKIEDKSKRRADSHARLLALDSKVYQAVLEMERATFGDGELSKRIKELIAVGISAGLTHEGLYPSMWASAEETTACKASVLPVEVQAGGVGFRLKLGMNGSHA